MDCKLNPQVVVTRVVLMDEPTVTVEAEITNYGNRDILLEDCLNVVCILALSDGDAKYVESELKAKKHWEDERWFTSGSMDHDFPTTLVKAPSGSNIMFEVELKDTKAPGENLEQDDYSKLEDLYVFTYLQINRETLADKYDIDMEMEAVSGWWRVGRILDDGNWDGSSLDELGVAIHGLPPDSTSTLTDDDDGKPYIFDIQDFRDLVEGSCSNGETPQ